MMNEFCRGCNQWGSYYTNGCSKRCPESKQPKIRGHCAECNESLREDYSYWVDDEGNTYCSESCATKHNGISEKEWEEESYED